MGLRLLLYWLHICSGPVPSSTVLMFQEVWGRSFCRTIEKLVEVVQEYPTEVEHIYSPSCVPLVRCAGCCGDENLECHPTQTSNVTMQVREAHGAAEPPHVGYYAVLAQNLFHPSAAENQTVRTRARIC